MKNKQASKSTSKSSLTCEVLGAKKIVHIFCVHLGTCASLTAWNVIVEVAKKQKFHFLAQNCQEESVHQFSYFWILACTSWLNHLVEKAHVKYNQQWNAH